MIARRFSTLLLASVLSTSALLPRPAAAVESYAVKPSEVAQMPDYCQAKIGGPAYAAKQGDWPQRFGALWLDMHHYCHGLKFIQRASRFDISDQDRNFNLMSAINEFNYVLGSPRSASAQWFLPQIHLEKALVYTRLGRHAEAAAEYKQAARRN